jgi:hypothetical protein
LTRLEKARLPDAILPVFLAFIGAEIYVGRSPELASPPIALNPLPWAEPQTWHYQISNIIDEPIGHATCTLTPQTAVVTLTCHQEQAGYEQTQESPKSRCRCWQDVLVTSGGSWPWQLAALTFEAGTTARLVHVAPDGWRRETQDMGSVVQTVLVKVIGLEEIETPGGPQEAWRVEIGKREVAWYDTAVPHTLLRYFNGMETWTIAERR